jgi:hypothetical protein
MKRFYLILLLVFLSVDAAYAVTINFSGTITSSSREWWGIENGSAFNGQITYTPVYEPPSDFDAGSGYASYYPDNVTWSITAGGYYFDFGLGTMNQVIFIDNKTVYGEASAGDTMSFEKYGLYPDTDCPIYSNISSAGGFLDAPMHPSLLWFNGAEQSLSFYDSFPDPIDFSHFTNGEFITGLDHAGTIESPTWSQLAGRIESVDVPEPSYFGLLFASFFSLFIFTVCHRSRS